MEITAELNNLRMAPRKVRLVAGLLRGKRVPEAERVLRFAMRHAARPLEKLLASAVANARHNFQIPSADLLVVSDIRVGGGPTLKRPRPRAFGRQFSIRKRTSHVTLTLRASGPVPARAVRRTPSAPIVAAPGEADAVFEAQTRKGKERESLRERVRSRTRPVDFVRRIFQRKAI